MKLFGIPLRKRQLALFAGDIVVLLLALYVGHFLRFSTQGVEVTLRGIVEGTTGASAVFLALHLLLLYVVDAYNTRERFRPVWGSVRVTAATTVAFLLQMASFYAVPRWSWGRGVSLIAFVSAAVLLVVWRLVYTHVLLRNFPAASTLVVGSGDSAQAYLRLVNQELGHNTDHEVVGYLCPESTAPSIGKVRHLGAPEQLLAAVEQHGVRQVVVALGGELPGPLVRDLFTLKSRGVRVVEMQSVYSSLSGRVPVRHIRDASLLFGKDFQVDRGVGGAIRRIGDVAVSAAALVLSAPVMLLAAVAIKVDSRGPVLYRQQRLGQGAEPFTIHKLRTMQVDAERDGVPVWALGPDDARVTRVGRFLRRTRVDELPQLWNVLVGEMSIVGPRPERPEFVRQLAEQIPYYHLRHVVKPGLTGWAQVSYPYGASVDDAAMKLEYELYAIQHMSPALYALILLKTVQTVLMRPGS